MLRTFQRGFRVSARRQTVYGSILDTIGNTPVVQVKKMGPSNVNLFVKCEYFNPLSSVKDRLALAVIEDAERSGALQPGQTVIEATSGNTGIALAMVCAAKGYPLVVTMAESFSVERRKVMRALGARVILTPAAKKGTGMVEKARELAEEHGWFQTRQFENQANTAYHIRTTGPEIVKDFSRMGLDFWCTGYGTGGTFSGAGQVIKSAFPKAQIVLAEPGPAPLLQSGLQQARNDDGSPAESHSSFTPHPIQGWTPDFIPLLTEQAMNTGLADQILNVPPPQAIDTSLKLASTEGIFTGISGGATMYTALEIAKTAPDGSNILAMLPDTAERYISTPLFADIAAEMNAEEQEISTSTAGFHVDN